MRNRLPFRIQNPEMQLSLLNSRKPGMDISALHLNFITLPVQEGCHPQNYTALVIPAHPGS